MPIIKSAQKRARQETVRRARNAGVKRSLREAIRSFEASLSSGKKADIAKNLQAVQKLLDTAVKKNIIHRNRASRKLSRLNDRAKAAVGTGKTTPTPAKKTATAKKSAVKKTTAKKSTSKTAKKS